MRKISQYSFDCDNPACAELFTYDGWTKKEADKAAREEGWAVNGKKCYCPDHRNKRK